MHRTIETKYPSGWYNPLLINNSLSVYNLLITVKLQTAEDNHQAIPEPQAIVVILKLLSIKDFKITSSMRCPHDYLILNS